MRKYIVIAALIFSLAVSAIASAHIVADAVETKQNTMAKHDAVQKPMMKHKKHMNKKMHAMKKGHREPISAAKHGNYRE